MKITGVTVMAAMVGTTVWAGALVAAERQVTVCMAWPTRRTSGRRTGPRWFPPASSLKSA